MRDDLMIVHQFNAKRRVRQKFDNFAFKFEEFFFGQNLSLSKLTYLSVLNARLYREFPDILKKKSSVSLKGRVQADF